MPNKVKLSVITINYNNRKGLERTIESVVRQSFRDFEYVVVDGLSTDGSRETISSHAGHIDRWVSEKDKNEYDAMNKGIGIATGDYVMFLNSGDTFYSDDALEQLFSRDFSEDFIYADVCIDNLYRKFVRNYPNRLTPWFLYSDMICHQVQIIRRSMLKKLGSYNIGVPIVADYDVMVHALVKNRASYRHIPVVLSVYQLGGKSGKPEFAEKIIQEKNKIHEKYFPKQELSLLRDFDTQIYRNYHDIVNSRSYRIFKILTGWNFLNRFCNMVIDGILKMLKLARRVLRGH